jgi:hypothetical protein
MSPNTIHMLVNASATHERRFLAQSFIDRVRNYPGTTTLASIRTIPHPIFIPGGAPHSKVVAF